MIALAQRFGLALDDLLAAEPAGSTETYYFDGHHYPYADACRDFAPVMRVLTRQSNEAPYPTQYDSYTHRALELDQMSVWEWIERYVPGGHHSKLGKLLDAAYDIEFGRATTEQSSLNLVYLLGGSGSSLSVFGESDERFHIRGGNQRLVDAIAAALPTDTVQVSHALTAIERHADGTTRLTFDTPTGTRVITADRVILTLPFSRLRQVDITRAGFDARKRRAIAELGYGTNAKVMLQFARRYWNEPGHAWGLSNGTTYADTGLQSAWDMTRAQPGTAGVFTDYLGSLGATIQPDQGDESFSATSPRVREYAARFMRQLEPVFPGISRHYTGVATLSSQKDDPNLLGTYSCWLVGQYTAFAGYEGVAQGTIHFAGEHCSTDFQGYMEGGAAEGERAATEILAALASAHR